MTGCWRPLGSIGIESSIEERPLQPTSAVEPVQQAAQAGEVEILRPIASHGFHFKCYGPLVRSCRSLGRRELPRSANRRYRATASMLLDSNH